MAGDKNRVDCETCPLHEGLDKKVCAMDKEVKTKLPSVVFRWAFGILILAVLAISGINYEKMDKVHSMMYAVDKNVAVIVEKVEDLEKESSANDREHEAFRREIHQLRN